MSSQIFLLQYSNYIYRVIFQNMILEKKLLSTFAFSTDLFQKKL